MDDIVSNDWNDPDIFDGNIFDSTSNEVMGEDPEKISGIWLEPGQSANITSGNLVPIQAKDTPIDINIWFDWITVHLGVPQYVE